MLLYDIGFFKLDGHRRSTMIESAHAAVASLNQADPNWRCSRPFYPKEQLITKADQEQEPPCTTASEEDLAAEANIIMRSIAKRSSDHHLLAQFTEVQKATLAATAAAHTDTQEESDDESDDDVSRDVSTASNTQEMSRINSNEVNISLPFKTRQELHVTYNAELARYEGLPYMWRRLNIQFGLPFEAVPKRPVCGYDANIPAVLCMLKESLVNQDGLTVEGIFRIGPDKDQCLVMKNKINDGTFTGTSDIHILANLIKVCRKGEEGQWELITQVIGMVS